MNAGRLLAHYEKIADAPDAIPRLRRFILDLAVRGMLVEQDPNDEPASTLLERITEEKAGRLKLQKSLPDFVADDLGDAPRNWYVVPLIALGEWAVGSGFPKNEQGRSDGPYFFLKVSDMNLPENDKYITTANNCIDGDAAKRMRATIHPAGTIIFPKIGGAIATNKRRIITRGSAIDNNCLGITFSSHINIEWAYLLMTHFDFTQYQAGTAVPALQQGTLATVPVALPPLAEQHRIVAKVDELLTLCDRLETARTEREVTRDRLAAASLARLNEPDPAPAVFQNHAAFALDHLAPLTTRPDQIKALRQTILNLAVRGKLVPQNPNDEPASELLARFRKAKAEQKRETSDARIKTAPDANDECLPFELPKGWCAQSFENIFLFIDYRGKTPPKTDNGVALITAKNVRMGHLDREPREYVSDDTFRTWMTRGFPRIGDLFFTTEAPLGNVCLNNIDKPFALAQRVICMQPYTGIDTRFLMYGLMSDPMQSLIHEHATGLTAKGIKAAKLKPLPVPLPPLAEQHRIVAKVDELMALCDRLEASLAAADGKRVRLLESLLHDALVSAAYQPAAARRCEA